MSKGAIARTGRGFPIYADFEDTYKAQVRVIESSSAERNCVWVFIDDGEIKDNDGAAHLTRKQAKKLRNALNAWLEETK